MTNHSWVIDQHKDVYYIIRHVHRLNYLAICFDAPPTHRPHQVNILQFYPQDDNPYSPDEDHKRKAIRIILGPEKWIDLLQGVE